LEHHQLEYAATTTSKVDTPNAAELATTELVETPAATQADGTNGTPRAVLESVTAPAPEPQVGSTPA